MVGRLGNVECVRQEKPRFVVKRGAGVWRITSGQAGDCRGRWGAGEWIP